MLSGLTDLKYGAPCHSLALWRHIVAGLQTTLQKVTSTDKANSAKTEYILRFFKEISQNRAPGGA